MAEKKNSAGIRLREYLAVYSCNTKFGSINKYFPNPHLQNSMEKFIEDIEQSFKDLINGKSPRFIFWIFPFISLIVLIGLPYLLTRKTLHESFAFDKTGQIGDTIGGITGPVIALGVGLLTFLAFWVQFQSNKAQTVQFNKQDTDTKIDRFETRFYELLRLHRDNVEEMSVGKIRRGRRVFLSMYDELQFCFYVVNLAYGSKKDETKTLIEDYNKSDLINIAYTIFFNGIGKKSKKLTESLLQKYDQQFIEGCYKALDACQKTHEDEGYVEVFTHREEGYDINFKLKLSYKPFQGHVSRLGHYYRHLFQTVRYVAEQSDNLIKNKYEYIKTLRAQLSGHEQLLLYYNSFTDAGKAWITNNYFTEYRFIRNIPLPLADIGVPPIEKLGTKNSKGEFIFELHEVDS